MRLWMLLRKKPHAYIGSIDYWKATDMVIDIAKRLPFLIGLPMERFWEYHVDDGMKSLSKSSYVPERASANYSAYKNLTNPNNL